MNADLQFQLLPVELDQGLPQAFSCTVGATSYDFGLYANLEVPDADLPDTLYDLATPSPTKVPQTPPGYLVLRIVRQGPTGPEVIFLRKLVPEPGLVHKAGELAVTLTEARVGRGNLNGAGNYGTRIVIGVAQRWA